MLGADKTSHSGWDILQQQQFTFTPQPYSIPISSTNPSPSTTLSLDRYIQLLSLLCHGSPDSRGWTVKHRDASRLKMDEIKQLLALQGYGLKGSRSKQEILNLMQGMSLATPFKAYPASTTVSSSRPSHVVDGLKKALQHIIPSRADEISDIVSQYGYFSTCSLLLDQNIQHPQNNIQHPTKITTHQPSNDNDHHMNDIDKNAATTNQPLPPPEWLVKDIQTISSTCQGSSDSCSHSQLIGRKVALVLVNELKTQQQPGDEYIDVLQQGIHVAQVTRWIGDIHDETTCSPCCTRSHSFYCVRVSPSQTLIETEADTRVIVKGKQKQRRRLELEVDLHSDYRVNNLEELLMLGADSRSVEERLADAWVLLEPREDE